MTEGLPMSWTHTELPESQLRNQNPIKFPLHSVRTNQRTVFAVVALLAAWQGNLAAAAGAESIPYPELVILTLSNAARLNPRYYRDNIASSADAKNGCITTAPALQAMAYSSGLSAASREHSSKMRELSCFKHDSCGCQGDQCGFGDRIRKHYQGGSALGENIVMNSSQDPVDFMNQWLASEGHCKNMYNDGFSEIGVGADLEYATQDFGNANGVRAGSIVSGTMVPIGEQTFYIAVTSRETHAKLRVVIDNKAFDMESASQGVHVFKQAGRASCKAFRFEIVDGTGKGSAFPAANALLRTGPLCQDSSVLRAEPVVVAQAPAPPVPAAPPAPKVVAASQKPVVQAPPVVAPSPTKAKKVVTVTVVVPETSTTPSAAANESLGTLEPATVEPQPASAKEDQKEDEPEKDEPSLPKEPSPDTRIGESSLASEKTRRNVALAVAVPIAAVALTIFVAFMVVRRKKSDTVGDRV